MTKKHYHIIYGLKGLTSLKKGDFAVAFLVCILLLFCFLGKSAGKSAAIYINGELYKTLPLNEDTVLLVESKFGKNTVVIENGSVYIKEADCPNKECEKESINDTFKSIICLPNRLSIIIEGENTPNETDVIL